MNAKLQTHNPKLSPWKGAELIKTMGLLPGFALLPTALSASERVYLGEIPGNEVVLVLLWMYRY